MAIFGLILNLVGSLFLVKANVKIVPPSEGQTNIIIKDPSDEPKKWWSFGKNWQTAGLYYLFAGFFLQLIEKVLSIVK